MIGLANSRVCAVAILVGASACSDRRIPTTPMMSPGAQASRDLSPADFSSFMFPGATGTLALDINEHDVIVGRYTKSGASHGFLRDASGTMTSIDYPGSNFTVAGAINDRGAITGWYTLPAATAVRHGFLLVDGTFTTFDPPGSTFTNATGINNRGDISGRFCALKTCRAVGNGDFRGFVLSNGQFTLIDAPGALETNGFKMNERGALGGGLTTAVGGSQRMFVLWSGEFTTFALPNGRPIDQSNGGINSRGDIVGAFCDGPPPCLVTPTGMHGFLFSDGVMTPIDYPGARSTTAYGINSRGDVVGQWADNSGQFTAFLLRHRGRVP